MCTLAVKEIALHYLNRSSNVYACFLDASKAFDRIRFDFLFETLFERGVNAIDLRLLLYLYENQRARTAWGDSFSRTFSSSNGIRQGSIISPILFCVYIDGLVKALRDANDGCWLGDTYFGVLIYADDITLLSPSVSGLSKMLKVCQLFCETRGVRFNPKKSICMTFTFDRNHADLRICMETRLYSGRRR